MERNITFIQDIQDAYATLTQLTIFISDLNGNAVTEVSGTGVFEREVLNKKDTSERIGNYISLLKTNYKPTIIDAYYGVKLIISPIRINSEADYYIIAGAILEHSTREFVQTYMKTKVEKCDKLLELFSTVPELTEDEKGEKIAQIGKLTEVVTTYLSMQQKERYENNKSLFVTRSLDALRNGHATTASLLEGVSSFKQSIDFIGLATEQEQDHYMVQNVYGNKTDLLKGLTFSNGEGFLGHTIAAQQFQFWGNILNDPRSMVFIQKGMKPHSLFCIPVYNNDSIKGVLFGGSYDKELDETHMLDKARILSALISVTLTTQNLNDTLQNHLMELSTFNEIFRVITTVKDIKRVLYILVDISINLIRGPFACIVFKPEHHDGKVEVVSRGLSPDEINDYCTTIAKKVFSPTFSGEEVKQSRQGKTSWGVNVLEFPLMFNDQIYGVLSVGYPKEEDPAKFKSFLSSLSVAGGVAINLRQENSMPSPNSDLPDLLHKLMEIYHPAEYQLTMKMKELTKSFASFINFKDDGALQQASSLAVYDYRLIREYISNQNILTILDEYEEVLQQKKTGSNESNILALVYFYLTHDEKVEAVDKLGMISDKLKTRFKTFINQQIVMESEISIENLEEDIQPSTLETLTSNLKRNFHISTRELDVLNHVLKGYSNREIALKLFISEHTVKNHMTNILQKLDVSDRSQVIAKVYQMGYSSSN